MADFDRIYFDSNILIASNWPRLSAALQSVFTLADIFDVEIYLPQAVEAELEEHWLRVFRDKCLKVNKANNEVTKHLSGLLENEINSKFLDDKQALAGYLKLAKEVKELWKIRTVPLTSRSVEEFFEMAVRQFPPFTQGDVGFKDAVIYFSVIDHLKTDATHVGTFVSADGIFSDMKLNELAKTAGVSLSVYNDLNDLKSALSNRVEGALKEAREKHKEQVVAVLKSRMAQIEKFLSENLEISNTELGFGSSLLAVKGLQVCEIGDVQMAFPFDRNEDEPAAISFEVLIDLQLVVRQFLPLQESPRLKVGEEAPQPDARAFFEAIRAPKYQEQTLRWTVEVEAISPAGDKDYSNIQLVSARSKGRVVYLRDVILNKPETV